MAAFDRAAMRRARAGLARSVRRDAAVAAASWALDVVEITRARRVGAYVAVGGELDPTCLASAAMRRGAAVYVPEFRPASGDPAMRFSRLRSGEQLEPGPFGIPVPAGDPERVESWQLDVVFVPLVAFDDQGTRVGMGGGHYDRAFSPARRPAGQRAPFLIGLGYHWQRVDRLAAEPWDVPLDAVLTDRGVVRHDRP